MSFKSVNFKTIALTIDETKPISETRIFASDFEVYVAAGNTGNIYVGNPDVDSSWIPRAPGTYWNFTHGSGEKDGPNAKLEFDLSKIFIASDDPGNSIIVQYVAGFVQE